MKFSPRLLAALLCLGLLTGCLSTPQEPVPSCAPDQAQRLTVYTSHKEEVWWPIVKEFEERTGIWVDVVEGGTNELLDRVADEAGAPAADVMFGGGVESLSSHAGCFLPYTCAVADDLDPRFRSEEDLWTPFSSLPIVLIYNTKLMSPGELTGWEDLLSPALRGQIAFADPAVSGSSFTAVMTCLAALGGGDGMALGGDEEALLRRLAGSLDGKQLSSSGDVLTAVAGGSAKVGVTLEETALQWEAEGADLALVYPAEGTSAVPDAGALIKGAPHPENAGAFLDFIVGRDVQALLTERFCRRSVRTDVESPQRVPMEDIPLADYDIAAASARREAVLMTWAFYLGDGGEEAAP